MEPEELMLFETELTRDEIMFGLALNTAIVCVGLRLSALTQILCAVYTLYRMWMLWEARRDFNRACRKYNAERKRKP